MSVRIRNIYYLLCYAWNHLDAMRAVATATDTGDRIEDLVAQAMVTAVGQLLAQGLDHGYVERADDIAGVRGKLLIGDSVRRLQFARAHATCIADELTPDVPHNQVVKATMRGLAAVESVDAKLRAHLRRHLVRFGSVSDIDLTPSAFRHLQLGRNRARYGFLLQLCSLVCRCLLPDARTGTRRFHPFDADEQEMGAVFETFIFNFFRLEQTTHDVARRAFEWNASAVREADLRFLPTMRTDLVLSNDKHRLVVETKYYASPLRYRRGSDTPKLISGHLYQLLSYLDRAQADPGPPCEGLLLYAGVGEPLELEYIISGFRVRVRTVELEQPWWQIKHDLLGLTEVARHADITVPVPGEDRAVRPRTHR